MLDERCHWVHWGPTVWSFGLTALGLEAQHPLVSKRVMPPRTSMASSWSTSFLGSNSLCDLDSMSHSSPDQP